MKEILFFHKKSFQKHHSMASEELMLAVYRGCECFPTQNDLVACNDDFGGTFQSEVTFAATAGEQYLIEVGGYGSEEGRGVITIRCEGDVEPGQDSSVADAS